jgi:RNA polymerase sigma-70 factor (ECF subfamily)
VTAARSLLAYKPAEVDLEDLLQEVAMRLVGKVSTLRDEANIRAWLRSIAVNVARTAGRSRSMPAADLEHICDDRPAAGPPVMGEGTREILRRVGQLPELYREPLMLRAVQGLRTKQIADILDVPPATVDTRIARARRMLRGEPLTASSLDSVTEASS